MDYHDLGPKAMDWFLTHGLRILVILFLAWVAIRLAKGISRRMVKFFVQQREEMEFQKRAQTVGEVVRYAMMVAIVVVASMTVLREIGINIGPILAAAGIVGLAVGFGAQSLVKDVISGFFILMEDQIRVGDVVQIAGKGGLVEKVNLRTTVLRDASGNVHYIPNGQIDVVTNMTKDYSRYVFDIGVAYRENVDEVIGIIREIDEGLRNDPEFRDDIREPIEVLGLDRFADSAVIIRARITTEPIKQWRVGREFNRRLKMIFDERNIEIPFPHMTLYMGRDKAGESPPLRISRAGN